MTLALMSYEIWNLLDRSILPKCYIDRFCFEIRLHALTRSYCRQRNPPFSRSHLREPELEYESAHLGDARRPLLEALQVVRGQDEESLLPPREHLVPLLPQQSLPQRRGVPQAAGQRTVHQSKFHISFNKFRGRCEVTPEWHTQS